MGCLKDQTLACCPTFCLRGETRFGEPGVFNLEGHPFSVLKWSATQFANAPHHQNIGATQLFSRLVHTLTPQHLGPCTTFLPVICQPPLAFNTQTGMENAQLGVYQFNSLKGEIMACCPTFCLRGKLKFAELVFQI